MIFPILTSNKFFLLIIQNMMAMQQGGVNGQPGGQQMGVQNASTQQQSAFPGTQTGPAGGGL